MQTVIIKVTNLSKGDWFIPFHDGKPEQVLSVEKQWDTTVIINNTHIYDVRDIVDLIV